MIKLEPTVRFELLVPQVVLGIILADQVYLELGLQVIRVTSMRDRSHSVTGSHPKGCGFDLGTKEHVPGAPHEAAITGLFAALEKTLGIHGFYLQLEQLGQANEHIHIHWRT